MEFKGTNSDWELHPNTSFGDGNVVRKGHIICMRQNGELKSFAGTWTPYNSMTDEEELANAKVMVCAPEMLQMLNRAITEINHLKYEYKDSGHGVKFIKDCEELIKKALGNG